MLPLSTSQLRLLFTNELFHLQLPRVSSSLPSMGPHLEWGAVRRTSTHFLVSEARFAFVTKHESDLFFYTSLQSAALRQESGFRRHNPREIPLISGFLLQNRSQRTLSTPCNTTFNTLSCKEKVNDSARSGKTGHHQKKRQVNKTLEASYKPGGW